MEKSPKISGCVGWFGSQWLVRLGSLRLVLQSAVFFVWLDQLTVLFWVKLIE